MSEQYNQDALDAASREVHMMLLREGSNWGTKACEEMGRVFMTAYRNALPSATEATAATEDKDAARYRLLREYALDSADNHPFHGKRREELDAAIDDVLREVGE